MIEVWTDGSSLRNGKPDCVGGWSFVTFIKDKLIVRYGHLSATSTNNRAEIAGVLYTILTLGQKSDWELKIYSDSQYVVKSLNEWRFKWKKAKYEGVKNADMLIPLFDAWDKHNNSKISWVKGHADTKGNQIADVWAGKGSRYIIEESYDKKSDIKFVSEESFLQLLK